MLTDKQFRQAKPGASVYRLSETQSAYSGYSLVHK